MALLARDVAAAEREEAAWVGAHPAAEAGAVPVAAPRARFRREASGGFGYSPYNEGPSRVGELALHVAALADGERTVDAIANLVAPGDLAARSRIDAEIASLVSTNLLRWARVRRPGRGVAVEDYRPEVSSRLGRLSAPLVVHWEPTLRCNLHCTTCYNFSGPTAPDGIDRALVLRQILDSGAFLTTILGGEPMVERAFVANTQALERHGVGVEFVTNGWLLTEEYLARLDETRVCQLMVSVDGMEETHDRLRGKRGSFGRAMEGVRRFADAGYDVTVSFTVLRSTLPELEPLIDLSAEVGAAYVKIRPIVSSGRADAEVDQDETLSRVDVEGYQPLLHRKLKELGGRLRLIHTAPVNALGGCFCLNDPSPYKTCGGPPCFVGRTLAYLRHDGGVAAHAFVREHVLGNILTEPLLRIWQDDARWAPTCP